MSSRAELRELHVLVQRSAVVPLGRGERGERRQQACHTPPGGARRRVSCDTGAMLSARRRRRKIGGTAHSRLGAELVAAGHVIESREYSCLREKDPFSLPRAQRAIALGRSGTDFDDAGDGDHAGLPRR